jgi:glycerol uptake facilitator-like aquaporin
MKKYLAELIGTFSLILFGCGSAVIAGISGTGPSGIGLLGIAIAFGFSVVAMAYAIAGAIVSALLWEYVFDKKETVLQNK